MTTKEVAAVRRALRALKKIDADSDPEFAIFQVGEAEAALTGLLP
jgi:hypothetical protein